MKSLTFNFFITVQRQSREEREEEKVSNKGTLFFSGKEKMKKSRKNDDLKNEEKALLFNLF